MLQMRWVTRRREAMISTNPGAIGAKMIPGYEHERVLQYRVLQGYIDASGALNMAQAKWGEWRDVPDEGIAT